MKRIKSGILVVLTASLLGNGQQVQAVNIEDVTKVAIVALASSGVVYGCYKVYETVSFNNAVNRLARNEMVSNKIAQREYNVIALDEQQLVVTYLNRQQEYGKLCGDVNQDVRTLSGIQESLDNDIFYWATSSKAQTFIAQAHQFSDINRERLQQATDRANFFNKNVSLITLAHLIDEEIKTVYYQLIYAATQQGFDERMARSYNAQSLWPLRVAWKDLEKRKQQYQKAVNECGSSNGQSYYVATMIQSARNTIAAYESAQCIIAGFNSYTEDLRAEKEFELREEKARQERIQAEAAKLAAQAQMQQAQAMAQQAQAQEQNIKLQKQQELAVLRNELSMIKQRIAQGDTSYYLYQQKVQLQKRINQLKIDLYGSSSWTGFIVECLTDQD